MRSQHSLEETAELYGLLENIKKEYETGIHSVLRKSNPELFSNPHTIPKLKKISINRGLGLAAQNSNILKKSITEFTQITGQKPLITRSKKAVAGFKIRENMEKLAIPLLVLLKKLFQICQLKNQMLFEQL
jgi:ribosomal protein L5